MATEGISKDSMRENMEGSAELLCENSVFFDIIEGVQASCIDRSADSLLLSISYQTDSEKPFSAAMRSSYYNSPIEKENINLRDSVRDDLPANQQSLLYWHGSAVIVRLLHLFMDLSGIYILLAVVMGGLFLWLVILLFLRKRIAEAISLIVALICVSIWFVPFSLEYIWMFILALVVSIVAFWFAVTGRWRYMGAVFLISGVLTNYLDFLTTETITLLVPILLILSTIDEGVAKNLTGKKAGDGADGVGFVGRVRSVFALKMSVLWGFGYVGMWLSKWLIASLVLGENVMPYVPGHISEQLGTADGSIFEAVFRNIGCLFPLDYGGAGKTITIIVLAVILIFCIVFRKKTIDVHKLLLYLVVGLIPYVRYLVLHNHANLNYFFTFRAQVATILALGLIVHEVVDWSFRRPIGRTREKKQIEM